MATLTRSLVFVIAMFNLVSAMTSKKPEIAPLPDFNREVPVLLYSGKDIRIEIQGAAALECYRGIKLSEVYYFSSEVKLRFDDHGIEVKDHNGVLTIGLTEVRCKPRNESTVLRLNGKSYRGFLRGVHREESESIMILNMVDLEEYLAGVLPGEIGDRTQDEYAAAKAQAVAARTYAVWKLTNGGSNSVLFPTIADQVYLGRDSEIDLLTRAVFETTGEVLFYDSKPIAAFYHAVCGGATIPVERAWPDREPASYLKSAKDGDYCTWAKTYSWTETFDEAILEANLKKYFVDRNLSTADDFGKIVDIEFVFDEKVGRSKRIDVFTDTGLLTVKYDQIRWALGKPSVPGAILPSTKFEVEKQKTEDGALTLVITGKGNGHGVGVCQCGAIGRARVGQKYEKILKSYYKDAKIERIY
ncbi:MAG: SpoIID/LytB domain-containing protein [candidate division Zixibacteria bacterium]